MFSTTLHFMKCPQGDFLWPCGLIDWDTSHQEGSRESNKRAIEKALGGNAKCAPSGLFYGLVARLMICWDGPLFALDTTAFSASWPDSLEPSWWEVSQPIGNKAMEKVLGATFRTGPKGLFYGLLARFS
jgi:hypothetical protein